MTDEEVDRLIELWQTTGVLEFQGKARPLLHQWLNMTADQFSEYMGDKPPEELPWI